MNAGNTRIELVARQAALFVCAAVVAMIGLSQGNLSAAASSSSSAGSRVKLEVEVDKPFLLAGKKQTVYLRVGLTGAAIESREERTPVNIAFVFDKSGSMAGEKIAKAKESAILALERLDSRDIVSFVTYDTTVNVLIPATKVSDKEGLIQAINRINADGNTALFAGVSKGAAEVRKFLSPGSVSRIVLLSDGLANVGPSSAEDLGELGHSLIKEGISVTTIGLGSDFNSALMTTLADKSDGSFYFAENATDLSWAYDREFGRALSVAARRLRTEIRCSAHVRPVRVLGRDAEIDGQSVSVYINDLYSEKEKHIILEVEIPAGENGDRVGVADVRATYVNPLTDQSESSSGSVELRFTDSADLVEEKTNARVVVDTVELLAVEKRILAYSLRDQGKIEEAKTLLAANARTLQEYGNKYQAQKLLDYAPEQRIDFRNSGAYTYDPTNGTVSTGDVWRVKQ